MSVSRKCTRTQLNNRKWCQDIEGGLVLDSKDSTNLRLSGVWLQLVSVLQLYMTVIYGSYKAVYRKAPATPDLVKIILPGLRKTS